MGHNITSQPRPLSWAFTSHSYHLLSISFDRTQPISNLNTFKPHWPPSLTDSVPWLSEWHHHPSTWVSQKPRDQISPLPLPPLRPSSSLSPLPASTPLHLYHTTLAEASYPLLDNYNSPMGSSNIDFRLYQSIPSLVEIRIIFSKQKSDHHLLNSIKPSMVLESQDKTWLINTPYKALQVWHN